MALANLLLYHSRGQGKQTSTGRGHRTGDVEQILHQLNAESLYAISNSGISNSGISNSGPLSYYLSKRTGGDSGEYSVPFFECYGGGRAKLQRL